MPGLGPQRGSEADITPGEPKQVDLGDAAAMAHQFYLDGRESVLHGGYQSGHDLGYDVGYGARNDGPGRGFATGVIEGHNEGMAARYELMDKVKEPGPDKAQHETQPELEPAEAEAG